MAYRAYRGFGDAASDAAALAVTANAAPLATVSPYALPNCGWGQKMVGSGPFTCQFDMGVALQQAWQVPGIWISTFVPGASAIPANALSAIAWGGVAYFLFGRSGGGRGR